MNQYYGQTFDRPSVKVKYSSNITNFQIFYFHVKWMQYRDATLLKLVSIWLKIDGFVGVGWLVWFTWRGHSVFPRDSWPSFRARSNGPDRAIEMEIQPVAKLGKSHGILHQNGIEMRELVIVIFKLSLMHWMNKVINRSNENFDFYNVFLIDKIWQKYSWERNWKNIISFELSISNLV